MERVPSPSGFRVRARANLHSVAQPNGWYELSCRRRGCRPRLRRGNPRRGGQDCHLQDGGDAQSGPELRRDQHGGATVSTLRGGPRDGLHRRRREPRGARTRDDGLQRRARRARGPHRPQGDRATPGKHSAGGSGDRGDTGRRRGRYRDVRRERQNRRRRRHGRGRTGRRRGPPRVRGTHRRVGRAATERPRCVGGY